MSKTNKPLTLSTLKKLDAHLNETLQVTLSNSSTILFDLHFRQTIIEEVFNKLISINKLIQEDETLKNFPIDRYTQLLIITHFTSLKNIETKSLSEELELMRILIDQNLFKEILEKMEIEIPDEIKKFNEKIFEIMQEKLDSLKQQEEFMRLMNEEIEKQKIMGDGLVDGEGEVVDEIDDSMIDVIAIENMDEVADIDEVNELVSKIEITD